MTFRFLAGACAAEPTPDAAPPASGVTPSKPAGGFLSSYPRSAVPASGSPSPSPAPGPHTLSSRQLEELSTLLLLPTVMS